MTSVGLQTQYEAVCENLGLIAYLVQVAVIIIIHRHHRHHKALYCPTDGRPRLDCRARTGTFRSVLNVSLAASGAQFRMNIVV